MNRSFTLVMAWVSVAAASAASFGSRGAANSDKLSGMDWIVKLLFTLVMAWVSAITASAHTRAATRGSRRPATADRPCTDTGELQGHSCGS